MGKQELIKVIAQIIERQFDLFDEVRLVEEQKFQHEEAGIEHECFVVSIEFNRPVSSQTVGKKSTLVDQV